MPGIITEEMRRKSLESRRRKAEERRMRQELAGIPDSNPPIAPEGTFEESSILDCHVGGVLVRELPVEVQGKILYQQTDEGIAEANEGKQEARARVVTDEYRKSLDHRRDRILEGQEPWQAPNAMKELAEKHVRPGFTPRFLSPAMIDKRGMRGWEPVLDENGNQVKARNMILAEMPKDAAERRNKHFRDKGKDALRKEVSKFHEESGGVAVGDIIEGRR